MWWSGCSRLQRAVPQFRPGLPVLSDSFICHLLDTAHLLTGKPRRTTEKPHELRAFGLSSRGLLTRRGPKHQTQIHPSSPLFRFVEWFAGVNQQAVFARLSLGRIDMKPARGCVVRRDGDARRDLALADFHCT